MKIDMEQMIPISKVNQKFTFAVLKTQKHEAIIIMKNNKPQYVLMTFGEYKAEKMEKT